MSGKVKRPGFDVRSGSRNRRTSRYGSQLLSGGNRSLTRHRWVRGITLAAVTPDQLTDTANGLAVFEAGDDIEVQLTASNDGVRRIDTVVAGQIDTINQNLVNEAAGGDVRIKTLANRHPGKFT